MLLEHASTRSGSLCCIRNPSARTRRLDLASDDSGRRPAAQSSVANRGTTGKDRLIQHWKSRLRSPVPRSDDAAGGE